MSNPRFGVRARTLIVTNRFGHRMCFLTGRIDEHFRKLTGHYHRGRLRRESYDSLSSSWDDRLNLLHAELEDIPQAVKANLTRRKDALNLKMPELPKEGEKKIIVINTGQGWQAFRLAKTVDEMVRILNTAHAMRIISDPHYYDSIERIRTAVIELENSVADLAQVERQIRMNWEK